MDYFELCQKVDSLGRNLVCVIVVKKGKLVASKVKPGLEALNEKRFADMFTQVQMMVGIPQTAEDLLGKMEHVKVRYGNSLDVYLFPFETPSEKTILVVAAMRPYDSDELTDNIAKVLFAPK